MRISELEATKQDRLKDLDALLTAKADRDFTEDEAKRFDALEAEVKELNAKIDREKRAEELRKQTIVNKSAKETPENEAAKQFQFTRALSFALRGKTPDGVEGEMHKEAENEMKSSGFRGVTSEGLKIPSFMLRVSDGKKNKNIFGQHNRDLTSGGSATGAEYVPDIEVGHFYGLEIMPKVVGLGAEVWRGLSGDVYLTKTGSATAVWEGETDANAETTPATSRVELAPKRLGAFTDISKTLLVQTNGIAEQRVKVQLEKAIARALDAAAINGSGGGGEPTGVLNFAGSVNSVAIGTDGGPITRGKLIEAWKKILEDNADLDFMSILTTPGVLADGMNINLDSGSGRFIFENGIATGLGMPINASNNVPSNLTKGTSSGVCHALILGVWNQLIIGQWGGLDIVVNPYTRAKENLLEIVVNSNWDIDAYHQEAFCHIKDITVS